MLFKKLSVIASGALLAMSLVGCQGLEDTLEDSLEYNRTEEEIKLQAEIDKKMLEASGEHERSIISNTCLVCGKTANLIYAMPNTEESAFCSEDCIETRMKTIAYSCGYCPHRFYYGDTWYNTHNKDYCEDCYIDHIHKCPDCDFND